MPLNIVRLKMNNDHVLQLKQRTKCFSNSRNLKNEQMDVHSHIFSLYMHNIVVETNCRWDKLLGLTIGPLSWD